MTGDSIKYLKIGRTSLLVGNRLQVFRVAEKRVTVAEKKKSGAGCFFMYTFSTGDGRLVCDVKSIMVSLRRILHVK